MNTKDTIKEIGLSDLEWRFVWHGSGGKDLWNRRGGRICIGSVNYDELLYVGENQFDLDNAKSLIERHNSDLLAVAQSKNAEIEKLKAENERLKAGLTAKDNTIQFLHGARQDWYEMYMQKKDAISRFFAGLKCAGARVPIDAMTMNAHEQGLSTAYVNLEIELERAAKRKYDLASVAERERAK